MRVNGVQLITFQVYENCTLSVYGSRPSSKDGSLDGEAILLMQTALQYDVYKHLNYVATVFSCKSFQKRPGRPMSLMSSCVLAFQDVMQCAM